MIQYNQKDRRLRRVRSKLAQNVGIPRLSVFRSNQHIWAQIIDDKHGKTLVSASTKSLKNIKGTKSEKAVFGFEKTKNRLTNYRINSGK